MKKTKFLLRAGVWLACAASALCLGTGALALEADYLVPVGRAVGIRLTTEGVAVAKVGEVECTDGTAAPAAAAGMQAGDVIRSLGGRTISTAEDFLTAASGLDGESVEILATREGQDILFSVTPALSADGAYRLGLWLRDGVNGIGTVTFYDPDSGVYGALGHGVSEENELIAFDAGTLSATSIEAVIPGAKNSPGELCGHAPDGESIASVESNTLCGIFGIAEQDFTGGALPVAADEEIALGSATVLANVRGGEVEEFEVEITRIYHDNGERGLMLHVTDPSLLAVTGGIVQGMSGSPIIQGGKLIGAVTHVLVSDPTRGYGITIGKMLSAVDESGKAA